MDTPSQVLARPVREFVGGLAMAKRLGVSRTRVYILAQEGRLNPAPVKLDGTLMLFHRDTKVRKAGDK